MDSEISDCVDSYFSDAVQNGSFEDSWEYASNHFGDGDAANNLDGDDLIEAAQEGQDEHGGTGSFGQEIRRTLVELAVNALTSKAASEINGELDSEGLSTHSEITDQPDGDEVRKIDDDVVAFRDDDEYHFWKKVEVRGTDFWLNVDDEHDADTIMVMEESLDDDDDEEEEGDEEAA